MEEVSGVFVGGWGGGREGAARGLEVEDFGALGGMGVG